MYSMSKLSSTMKTDEIWWFLQVPECCLQTKSLNLELALCVPFVFLWLGKGKEVSRRSAWSRNESGEDDRGKRGAWEVVVRDLQISC